MTDWAPVPSKTTSPVVGAKAAFELQVPPHLMVGNAEAVVPENVTLPAMSRTPLLSSTIDPPWNWALPETDIVKLPLPETWKTPEVWVRLPFTLTLPMSMRPMPAFFETWTPGSAAVDEIVAVPPPPSNTRVPLAVSPPLMARLPATV